MAIIYLVFFLTPQVLLFRYLWVRLPDPERPGRARLVRILPIYYIALAGCLALMLWSREPFKLTELLGNVFFVQSLFWQQAPVAMQVVVPPTVHAFVVLVGQL